MRISLPTWTSLKLLYGSGDLTTPVLHLLSEFWRTHRTLVSPMLSLRSYLPVAAVTKDGGLECQFRSWLCRLQYYIHHLSVAARAPSRSGDNKYDWLSATSHPFLLALQGEKAKGGNLRCSPWQEILAATTCVTQHRAAELSLAVLPRRVFTQPYPRTTDACDT